MCNRLIQIFSLRSLSAAWLLAGMVAPQLEAAAVNVRIAGLSTTYSAHDISAIATELNNMLAVTPGYSGSSSAATVFSGRSLTEAYYHPSYRDATRAAVVGDYDYLVILPETAWLYSYPEMTFDGVLQMSRKALGVGTTPLLLMPGTGNSAYVGTLGTNSYRIGNGCGIHVVPGGYAAESASLLTPSASQTYLLAAAIFTKITGLNAASGSSYAPSVSNYSTLAETALTTVNTHNSTTHYTTSRENSGLIRYRKITPAGNSLRYAKTGTSTEQGISVALTPILQASGYTVNLYSVSSTWGWTSAMATSAAANFATNANQYVLAYVRSPFVEVQSSTMTDPNQPNLLPIAYDQQYTGMSNTGTLEDFYSLTESARQQCLSYGFSTVPIHLGAARLNVVDPSLVFSGDGTHWNPPFYNMIAAMMATTSLGREPTPPAAVLADSNLLNGFNVGKQLVRQLAFLAETETHVPDTALAIAPLPSLTAVKNQAFNYNFTATGGTTPYTWSVESTTGLPAGLTLSPNGILSGIATTDAGNWQLVIQVKDSTGAIRKIPATLSVALTGSGTGTLAMTPGDSLNAYGNVGGPFSPTSQVYTLSNVGTTSINWTAAKTQSWVTLSATSGTLAAGANTTVTVSINNADALAAGAYTDTVTFTNTTNNNGNTTRGVALTINSLSTTLTWDANGSLAGQTDGAGTWLATNQWWNGTVSTNWVSSRNATFGNGGTGGAVTLASPTTVNALAFNAFTGTYTLGTSGQTLALNGGITMDSAAGAVALVSPVSLGFPQTWTNNSSNSLTVSTPISGSGGLTKSGTGTMILAPDTDSSSYAGATTVGSGVLNIQKSTALGSVASGTTVSSGATLQIQGSISVGAEALALDGSGVSNTGALRNVSGTNFFNGLLTLNGATRIQSDAGTLVLSNTGTITGSGAALTVAGAGQTSIMGDIATGNGSLTKEGAGTLTLYGVSTYSGGTTINGGHISLATTGIDSLGAVNSSVTVNDSTTLTANGNTTLQKSFALTNNSTLTFANSSSHITVTGAVTGNGGIRPIGGAASLGQRITTLSSTSNSFTGPISNPVGSNFADLSLNSLYDGEGAGNITFGEAGQARTMRVALGSGATSPLVLNTRQLVINGSTPTANFSNSSAQTLTVNTNLVNNSTGAATFELSGWGSGINRFAGNITNGSGGGTLGFTKSGGGTWVLSGTNTYSGVTINGFSNPAGTLIFQGLQALPSSTTLQQTNGGGTGGFATIKLLDDSATPASRAGVNLAMFSSPAGHVMTLFVGNNSTTNGGTSSSTQTGSAIALGSLNFIQNNAGNTSQTLTVNGANNYALSIQNVDLPALLASSTTWAGILNPVSAPLTVAGNVRQKADTVVGTMTLRLDGTASGNQVLGTIMDSADATPLALAVSKTNNSVWTLSGDNSYTGNTTVSAGKLFFNGDQSLATGAVSVAASATLGGTGTLGGNVAIAASGKLEFTISTTPAGHDKLELASGKSLTLSGASTLTINSPGGVGPGIYTLITAPGGITGVAPATVNLPSGWVATASISGNDLRLVVTETPGSAAGNIVVTPGNSAAFSGTVGGPFLADSVSYTLTNGGATPVNWTALKSTNWVNLSATNGTLAAGASTEVIVSVNSDANALAIGSYIDTVTITDTTNGGSTARDVNLAVTPPQYGVSYNGNGNTGGTAPANQSKFQDIDLTIRTNSGNLVKTGFVFAGWNTATDGSGANYSAGSTYTANAPLTLYAKWVSDGGSTWLPTVAGSFNWGDAANWVDGIVASGTDRTASFIPDITADQVVSLEVARTIGNIIFTDSATSSHNLTISGANTLTLDRTSGVPVVDVTQADRTLTIASVVAGADGLEKIGSGILTLSGNNTYTGTTTISAGTLRLEGNAFKTTARNYSISSGAVLHQAGSSQTPLGTTTISGSGTLRGSFINGINTGYNLNLSLGSGGLIDIPFGGSIYNGGWTALTWSSNQATLNMDGSLSIVDGNAITADALTGAGTITSNTVGGTAANFTLGVANGSGTYSGAISAAGTRVISLVKNGTGTQIFSGSTTWKGTTTINGGTLQYAKTSSLYAGVTTDWVKAKIIVNTGGTIAFNVGGTDEFTTGNVTTLLSGLGGAVNNNGLRAGSAIAFDTSNASGTFTIANTIANTTSTGGGAVGFKKLGTGTLELSGPNSYTGSTTISGGTLLITGNQTAATGAVSVANGATLGGTGIIGGSTTIDAGGKLEFNISTASATHNALDLAATKTLTFSGTSVLTINSISGASIGTYTLLTAPGGIIGSAPATLNLPAGWMATVSIYSNSLMLHVTSVGSGPLDHFAISTIASPQTVGTPITGITITAQDAANQTVTSFTGTVTFGGTGGFSGTSASFTAGVLTGVSVTPTTAGSDLTFTVNDGSGHTGSAMIATIRAPYTAWSGGTAFDADTNGDGVKDGLAWMLGAASPSGSMQGKLPLASSSGGNLRMTFRCLKSTARGAAVLKLQSSSDLGLSDPWTSHEASVPESSSTVNGVLFTISADADPDFINVTAEIPASGSKIFSRIMATE